MNLSGHKTRSDRNILKFFAGFFSGLRRRKLARKLIEDRLAAMEETQDGIGIVDKNGNLQFMNRALRELHEIPPERAIDYIGKSWTQLYNSRGQEDIRTKVLPVLERHKYWRGESPIARKSGELMIAELSLTGLPDGGFIGTARDITKKKRTQKENEQLLSQFYQAQKMEAIGRLAGGIAHDFNNILAAMNGNAEFLIDDLDEKTKQHKYALNILQAGMQARMLVDQILAFSRRSESNIEAIDIIASVHESVSMLKASLPKTIDVETDIRLITAPISGNQTQISQVIMNLCVNARDAMIDDRGVLKIGVRMIKPEDYKDTEIVSDNFPEEGVAPMISIQDREPGRTWLAMGSIARDHDYICLSVQDTGSGMSRTVMEHIFEPFFTTKSVDKGTGLGLSTVHGVIAGHQGAMIVDSCLNKGTTFEIFLPMSDAALIGQGQTEEDYNVTLKGHVLLVEDQPDVREMMANMLARMGLEVSVCVAGLEALDFLRENPGLVNVVITDHNMPKMTGLELVYQAHFDFPDLPFILISGYSQKKLQALMEEHPAIKAILRKPISRPSLARIIGTVMKDSKKQHEAAA